MRFSGFPRQVDKLHSSGLFTQRVVVIPYQRFGTTYRFHLPGSSIPKRPRIHQ